MIDTLQINKFCELHNGYNIIFCKTDFLPWEFEYIKKLNNDVILISGNSDYMISKHENPNNIVIQSPVPTAIPSYLLEVPKNIKKWFAQNASINNDIIKTLPMGLENYIPAIRQGHGVGYDRVKIKQSCIDNKQDRLPSKFIWANFEIGSKVDYRTEMRDLCKSIPFIDWEDPNLTLEEYFDKILDYDAVICPEGNGIDTHRFYEVLYMKRIPIVFNKVMYENLYHMFPVVFIENTEDLKNYEFMIQKIREAKEKEWDPNSITTRWWKDRILSS